MNVESNLRVGLALVFGIFSGAAGAVFWPNKAASNGEAPVKDELPVALDELIRGKAVGTSVGNRVIELPAGRILLDRPLEVRDVRDFVMRGRGAGVTTLVARGVLFSGKPILRLVNCPNAVVENLTILGDPQYPSSAVIESHVDNPTYDFSLWPTRQQFRQLSLGDERLSEQGKRPRFGMLAGIRFTAADGSDGNNDQSSIENVTIHNFRDAAVSIEHGNSLLHRISGGVFAYGRFGVSVAGGSFQITGTNLFVDECDFVFEAPSPRTLRRPGGESRDTSRYYHGSSITAVASEGESDLLRTAAWPAEPWRPENGLTGIHVSISGYQKSGVRAGPTPRPLGRAIDFRSAGHLSITGSNLNFGRPTSFFVANPKAVVTLAANRISHLREIDSVGRIASLGNFFSGGVPVGIHGEGLVELHRQDIVDLP